MIHLIRERELGLTLTSPGDMWDLGFSLSGSFSDPGPRPKIAGLPRCPFTYLFVFLLQTLSNLIVKANVGGFIRGLQD